MQLLKVEKVNQKQKSSYEYFLRTNRNMSESINDLEKAVQIAKNGKGDYNAAKRDLKVLLPLLLKNEHATVIKTCVAECSKYISNWDFAYLPEYYCFPPYDSTRVVNKMEFEEEAIVEIRRRFFTEKDFFLAPLFLQLKLYLSTQPIQQETKPGINPMPGDQHVNNFAIPDNNNLSYIGICIRTDRDIAQLIPLLKGANFSTLKTLRFQVWKSQIEQLLLNSLVEAIANNPSLKELSSLVFADFCMSDDSLKILAASPYLKSLTDLAILTDNLYHESSTFTKEGLRILLNSDLMQKVNFIELCSANVNDESIEVLNESKHITKLEYLHLYRSSITDQALENLQQIINRNSLLNTLCIMNTKLSDEATDRLYDKNPNLYIQTEW